jgi:hypothetical protein
MKEMPNSLSKTTSFSLQLVHSMEERAKQIIDSVLCKFYHLELAHWWAHPRKTCACLWARGCVLWPNYVHSCSHYKQFPFPSTQIKPKEKENMPEEERPYIVVIITWKFAEIMLSVQLLLGSQAYGHIENGLLHSKTADWKTQQHTSCWMEKPGESLGCCQMPMPRWLGKMQTTRWAKWYMVLPQTTLGQISIVPWTEQPPPR